MLMIQRLVAIQSIRHPARTMATTTAPLLHKFLVYAPDRADSDTLEKRLAVRAAHLAAASPNMSNGVLKVAGALLTPESIESAVAEKKMVGSVLIVEAKSMTEVRELVENDIYYTSGVWDPERLEILPFQPAMPLP